MAGARIAGSLGFGVYLGPLIGIRCRSGGSKVHARCGRNRAITVSVSPEPRVIRGPTRPPTPLIVIHRAFTLAAVVFIILVVLFISHYLHFIS